MFKAKLDDTVEFKSSLNYITKVPSPKTKNKTENQKNLRE